MRSIKTFDDFIDLASKLRNPRRHLDLYPIARLTVDIARGDLVAAEAICEYLKTKEGKRRVPLYGGKSTSAQCKSSVRSSPPMIGLVLRSLLHSYEAQSVKNLKTREISGSATPFPIEMES